MDYQIYALFQEELIDELIQKNQELGNELNELRGYLVECNEQIKTLRNKSEGVNGYKDLVQGTLRLRELEIESLNGRVSQLYKTNQVIMQNNNDLKEQISTIQKENAEIEVLRESNKRLKQQLFECKVNKETNEL